MARQIGRRTTASTRWTSAAALALILGVTGWTYTALRLAEVPSKSMLPTLQPGDVVTNRIDAFRHAMPKRGDIVIFHDKKSSDLLIKRVIGIPGETIVVWSGLVWVNGQMLREPYLTGNLVLERPIRVRLAADEIWVMGDNRDFSDDSRDYGPVKKSQLVGRASAIIWPLSRRHRILTVDVAKTGGDL
jgi:signal peptidase I